VKHEIFVPSEEEDEILAVAAYRNILRIKKTLAEQRMTLLQQQLRDLNGATPDEADQLMLEYMHVKRINMQISQELGTVISG
jgi:DNA primase